MNKSEGMMAKEKGKITKPYLIMFFLIQGYPCTLLIFQTVNSTKPVISPTLLIMKQPPESYGLQ